MSWKTIDTAPKDGEDILLTNGHRITIQCWGENDDGDPAWTPRERGFVPSHWDYLPDLPK